MHFQFLGRGVLSLIKWLSTDSLIAVCLSTWHVRRTCVTQTYDSPEAVRCNIMEHLTCPCIYESIKPLHKDKVLLCYGVPFILYIPLGH